MRRYFAVLAMLVMCASLIWGVWILAADVTPASVKGTEMTCGSVRGALEGKPLYGGELPYPRDWIDQCRDAAQDQIDWIVVPAVAGPLSLLYLGGALLVEGRRAKAEGRSAGAMSA